MTWGAIEACLPRTKRRMFGWSCMGRRRTEGKEEFRTDAGQASRRVKGEQGRVENDEGEGGERRREHTQKQPLPSSLFSDHSPWNCLPSGHVKIPVLLTGKPKNENPRLAQSSEGCPVIEPNPCTNSSPEPSILSSENLPVPQVAPVLALIASAIVPYKQARAMLKATRVAAFKLSPIRPGLYSEAVPVNTEPAVRVHHARDHAAKQHPPARRD